MRLLSYDFELAPNGTAYTTALTPYTITAGTGSAVSDNSANNHLLGSYSALITVNAETKYFKYTLNPPRDVLVSGIWFTIHSIPGSPATVTFLEYLVGGVVTTIRIIGLDSKFQMRNAGTVLWTSAAPAVINTPYWVEFKVDAVSGVSQVRLYNGLTGVLIEDSGPKAGGVVGSITDAYCGIPIASTTSINIDRHIVDDYAWIGFPKGLTASNIWVGSFEVPPAGTSLFAGNTGYSLAQGTGKSVSDDTQKYEGSYSLLITTNNETKLFQKAYASILALVYTGMWFKPHSFPPSGTQVIMQQNSNAPANLARIVMKNDGHLDMRDANAVVWTSNITLVLENEYWIEWKVDANTNTQVCRIYQVSTGRLLEESPVCAYSGGPNLNSVNIGAITINTASYSFDYHTVDIGKWTGPLAVPAAGQAGMTKVDRCWQWLTRLGYTGTINDMQYFFLYDQVGPKVPSLTSPDMQIRLGKKVRDVLIPEDWPTD